MASLGVWRGRLSAALAPRPAAAQTTGGARGQTTPGAANAPQRPKTGKMMLGMLAFVAGAELLLFLVQMLDVRFFKSYLTYHYVASPNTPILGGLSWFLLILMVLTLGLWIALNRLGIIQPLTPRPQAQTGAARGGTAAATTMTALEGRNRAARRKASETVATATAKGGTAKGAAGAAASGARHVSSGSDASYQRVKAAQRSRKRRAAKR